MKRMKRILALGLTCILSLFMVSCSAVKKDTTQENYEGRAFYEIFVRSFNDSDGDGVGDLKGVIEKLDYLEELGIKGIWLMPILQSESYHGYDVDDYYAIDDEYGTEEDFKELLKEAHKRDIKVIMDLVINHTSVNNEWFVDARENENSEYRDYYIWSDDVSLTKEVSPMNTFGWHKNGNKEEVYYGIFWGGMPDLNFDNPKVIQEVKDISKYYLDIGVDGFRLDAAKWIFLDTDKNVDFWTDLNSYVKSINKKAVLVGEVWDSPYNTVNYTTCLDSFFEFSMGDYITDRIVGRSISGFTIDYNNVNDIFKEENEDFIMASFLSNHDQARVIGAFYDDYQMKTAAIMYLTLPGTPFIYYGEEIGMEGSGADENKRQPFIWSSKDESKNTSWEAVSFDTSEIAVDVQEDDENSLLNFYKDVLKVRNNYKCLRLGEVDSVETSDNNILAMERTYKKETAYVIVNGNDEKGSASIPKGDYEIVYSNKDKEGSIDSNGSIDVEEEEMIIIIKK